MTKISVSILGSDLANIATTVAQLESAGADMIHLDVMDGVFVPNITFGQEVVKCIRAHTSLPLDTHLMIQNPENHIDDFIQAGCNTITFHVEATDKSTEIIAKLKQNNIEAGVSIKPKTSLDSIKSLLPSLDQILVMSVEPGFAGQSFIEQSLEKIKELRNLIDEQNLQTKIFADGGVGHDNATSIINAGADVLVAASAVLKNGDYRNNISKLKP